VTERVVFVSLNTQQLQQIRIGLLQFREALNGTTDDLVFQRRIANGEETVRLVDTLQTVTGAIDDFAATLQSALGLMVARTQSEEYEQEVGASV
jgi:hypothetical protein